MKKYKVYFDSSLEEALDAECLIVVNIKAKNSEEAKKIAIDSLIIEVHG